jgi:carbon storage regulator
MLVLTRRPDEGLVLTVPGLAEPVVVTVLAVEGDKVKVGIAAPRTVTVLRQELCDAVRDHNLAAARQDAAAISQASAGLRSLLGPARPADPGNERPHG